MTEQELLNAAKTGNVGAIEDYVEFLSEKGNPEDRYTKQALEERVYWARKGAEAGSHYCMMMNAIPTTRLVETILSEDLDNAEACLKDLCQAESWVLTVLNAGKLQDDSVLTGSNNLYTLMVKCYSYLAVQTKNENYLQEMVKRYRMIKARPRSDTTWAYINALRKFERYEEVLDLSIDFLTDHDHTVANSHLENICLTLSYIYFNGKGGPPDYETAFNYVKLAAQYNPNCEMLSYFESGEARKDFNAANHSPTSASNTSSGGCYVATAVYGSYDCPQVWTLRRFRDDVLASSFAGRLFIRTYYAISPTLVKWFGHCAWFRNLWKPTLDRMVAKLNASGTENTPYQDRSW